MTTELFDNPAAVDDDDLANEQAAGNESGRPHAQEPARLNHPTTSDHDEGDRGQSSAEDQDPPPVVEDEDERVREQLADTLAWLRSRPDDDEDQDDAGQLAEDQAAVVEDQDQQPARVLLDRHRDELTAQAIELEIIDRAGVRSVERAEELAQLDLPDWWANHLPAKLYPWQLNGRIEWQLAPDDRTQYKYLFRPDAEVPLNQLHDTGDGLVLLVEGTKQHLAAASYAPDDCAVYGIDGCWGWSKTDLSRFAGRLVLVTLDADFRSNRDVYDAAKHSATPSTPSAQQRSSSSACPAPAPRVSTTSSPSSPRTSGPTPWHG